jgi:hypothetical protein
MKKDSSFKILLEDDENQLMVDKVQNEKNINILCSLTLHRKLT